jgi:hypothetical protein
MVAISPRALSRATVLYVRSRVTTVSRWNVCGNRYQGDGDGSIPGWLQRAEVTGEGGRVAGDIDDPGRPNGGEALADPGAEAGTRRIDDD